MTDRYHHGDLRRALIDAAVASIAESGPSALSLRAVAKLAGVSHAAPAHHFGDKAGLLTAVAAEGYDRFADALERAWKATGDFVEVGIAYVRFAIDNKAYFETMFRPELLHEDDPDLQRAEARSNAALVRGAGEQRADAEFNPEALGAWSLVHGFAGLLMGGNFPPAVVADPEGALREIAKRVRFGKPE
ncbi:TetR/AcrR family transcriptional regulator [Glycomyces algeriensis]|uniref:TetR/AcrR family transcriptional regulator n=1 Tax=Glycomyces algeriensis TaxID=256037 RepID=UPI0022DB22B3|nr:TetR/AcrR family transcriptional regulator [Glycomyces algeriensis]MDA1366010.1 TetR/AcrR family transcriptional regulator [Glycomyces algeriensis]MDR7349223.1 AcrR family transcriptional regulator [Glycomyces algeriensis]